MLGKPTPSFSSHPKGDSQRRKALCHRSQTDQFRPLGRFVAWSGCGDGYCCLQCSWARNHCLGPSQPDFIQHATQGFEAYAKSVESFTLDFAERESGVPKATIREMAHTYAKAGRAIICWTLGITEHHNAADNVQSLINLALLTGHIGKYGSGLNPLRGQNNVQGGGDMGALPDRLPGFQHIEVDAFREKFNRKWNTTIPPKRGWNLTEMFHAMEKDL